jgi:hypothetical protein
MTARCPVRRVRIGAPRKGLVIDEAYKAWIRKQPCVCCGTRRYVEAAHVGTRGLGQKASDYTTLPLCSWHHVQGPESHHAMGKRFFQHWGLDRVRLIDGFNTRYEQEQAA